MEPADAGRSIRHVRHLGGGRVASLEPPPCRGAGAGRRALAPARDHV